MSKPNTFRFSHALLLVVALMAMMNSALFAQSAVTGAINGTVSDPAGAVISNATITIKSVGTNKEQTATTNEISRNVTEAANGATDIANNIAGVATAAQDTTRGAADTQTAARSLSEMASELQTLVGRFRL